MNNTNNETIIERSIELRFASKDGDTSTVQPLTEAVKAIITQCLSKNQWAFLVDPSKADQERSTILNITAENENDTSAILQDAINLKAQLEASPEGVYVSCVGVVKGGFDEKTKARAQALAAALVGLLDNLQQAQSEDAPSEPEQMFTLSEISQALEIALTEYAEEFGIDDPEALNEEVVEVTREQLNDPVALIELLQEVIADGSVESGIIFRLVD